MTDPATTVDLTTTLGRLTLPNPIMTASGTFGYAREMENLVDLSRLGAVVPKTVTPTPRPGNRPWRTIETASGLLNSIGLDNDGVDAFIEHHVPYLRAIGCPVVVSLAAKNREQFSEAAALFNTVEGIDALELNISCPNVSGGIDFASDPEMCRVVVQSIRDACSLPILTKLSPNVTKIADIAQGAVDGGTDAVVLINTLLGMAVDWRRRRPLLGNVVGGLSGPAIKPVALRCVHQVRQAVSVPIVGVGGIMTIDDVMEFLVAGASAVQIGTASFHDPTITMRLLDALPGALAESGHARLADLVGSLNLCH